MAQEGNEPLFTIVSRTVRKEGWAEEELSQLGNADFIISPNVRDGSQIAIHGDHGKCLIARAIGHWHFETRVVPASQMPFKALHAQSA